MTKVVLLKEGGGTRFVSALVSDTYNLGSNSTTAAHEIRTQLSEGSFETPEAAREIAYSVLDGYGIPRRQITIEYGSMPKEKRIKRKQ